MDENENILEVAKKAARKGGDIILKYFNKDVEFRQKKDKSPVSIADEESEREIRKIILENFSNHSIYGEEEGRTGKGKIIWYIDPLDGTSNFKNKIPLFCVSIGVQRENEFIVGVIYNPLTNELFYALKSKGAFLNEKRVNVNNETLEEGIVVIDASFNGLNGKIKTDFQKDLIKLNHRLRMIGSNALQLAELAKGTFVFSLSDHIDTYDFVAGIVLVREAGGVVTDQFGNEPTPETKVVVASNNQINHEKIIHITRDIYRKNKDS